MPVSKKYTFTTEEYNEIFEQYSDEYCGNLWSLMGLDAEDARFQSFKKDVYEASFRLMLGLMGEHLPSPRERRRILNKMLDHVHGIQDILSKMDPIMYFHLSIFMSLTPRVDGVNVSKAYPAVSGDINIL